MLWHAPWCGPARLNDARVLDAFAGTGALGLEALSRGARHATFIERAPAALAALRANIAACGAGGRCRVLAVDALAPPAGERCAIAFLDPPYGGPYGGDALAPAVAALCRAGWIGGETLIVAESSGRESVPSLGTLLADRSYGAARVTIWQAEAPARAE
jgi:16S rRNA (guanine966-N2)-methyltransferase